MKTKIVISPEQAEYAKEVDGAIQEWQPETFFEYLKEKFDLVFTAKNTVVTREAAEAAGIVYYEQDLLTRFLAAVELASEV